MGNEISEKKGLTIGNDVWIGLNSVILYGITNGNGATIAAVFVVTKDVLPYCVVGRVPVKVISRKCSEEVAFGNEIHSNVGCVTKIRQGCIERINPLKGEKLL